MRKMVPFGTVVPALRCPASSLPSLSTGKPSVVAVSLKKEPGRPVNAFFEISSICTMALPLASWPVITRRSCSSAMRGLLGLVGRSAEAPSDGRLDVLVHPPEVGRVVPILELDQARVVGGVVGGTDPLVALATHLVDVHAPRERLQRRAELPAPLE